MKQLEEKLKSQQNHTNNSLFMHLMEYTVAVSLERIPECTRHKAGDTLTGIPVHPTAMNLTLKGNIFYYIIHDLFK